MVVNRFIVSSLLRTEKSSDLVFGLTLSWKSLLMQRTREEPCFLEALDRYCVRFKVKGNSFRARNGLMKKKRYVECGNPNHGFIKQNLVAFSSRKLSFGRL